MPQTDLIIHDEKDNVAVVVIGKTSKKQVMEELLAQKLWVIKNLLLQNFIEALKCLKLLIRAS